MRAIATVSLILLVCGFALADQDDIDLDPGGGKWYVKGGSGLPGERGRVRDDLLKMPAGMERAICYNHPVNGPSAASKLRYVIKDGAKPGDYKSVTIVDKDGDGSGVRIRWNDYIINKPCKHAVTDDCQNSGVPPELWGNFVGGKVEVKDKTSGVWRSIDTKVQIQKIATGAACAAL